MRYPTTSRKSPLLATGLFLLLTGSGAAQANPPLLTGRWTLNLELSEQIDEKLSDAMRQSIFSRLEAQAGTGATGVKKPPVDDKELVGLLRAPLLVTIRQDDSTVAISDAGGFMVAYPTDGRKVKEYMLSGETMEISARWKDGTLTIERKQDRAGWVRESYAIDQARGKLVVTLRLKTASLARAMEHRRVYDSNPGS